MISTGILVSVLVAFNVIQGGHQELKALAAVDALATLQVPHARARRNGTTVNIAVSGIVPGDIVLLEAGDLVPADGRILRSASLETQEAALTGESAPIPKDAGSLPEGAIDLGDRSNILFQTPFQKLLGTQPLTADQWLIVFGLALIVLVVAESEKALRRRRRPSQALSLL